MRYIVIMTLLAACTAPQLPKDSGNRLPEATGQLEDVWSGMSDAPFTAASTDRPKLFLPCALTSLSEDAPAANVIASTSIRHSTSIADVSGGLPSVLSVGRPIAGSPHRVQWSMRPTTPPEPPFHECVLLVSLLPMQPEPIQGGAGGMWLARSAGAGAGIISPTLGSALTQDGGRVFLDWTPPRNLVGRRLHLQLITADNRVPGGLVGSPLLILNIGNN